MNVIFLALLTPGRNDFARECLPPTKPPYQREKGPESREWKPGLTRLTSINRGAQIRTGDLLLPKTQP